MTGEEFESPVVFTSDPKRSQARAATLKDGKPFRVVICGQEYGQADYPHHTLEKRYQQVAIGSGLNKRFLATGDYSARNPHMKGALRTCHSQAIYREQGSHTPVVILERGLDLPGGEMIIKSGVLAPVTASGGAIICAMALAGWWFARLPQSGPAATPRPLESLASHSSLEQPALSPDAHGAVAPSAASSGPRIDVARIMPNGDVVVAGWAEPGARIALLDGGDTLQETQADGATGEFVFLPPRLGAGAHQLSLRSMTSSDGAQTKETAIQTFSILPQIKTSNAGNLAPAGPAVDQEPRAFGRGASSGKATTIMQGDTLWRISRERLGRGSLYPTIYEANSKNIRDPNLIYPGRTLMIP